MSTVRRFGAIVCVAATLATGSAVIAPGRALAALQNGSWVSPTANQVVSGTVHLDYSTPNSAVTFVFPNGTMAAATVAGGTATGSWDSTGTANGFVQLGAQECDTLGGCMTTNVTVNVENATPATAPSPTPTPAPTTPAGPTDTPSIGPGAGMLKVGQKVTVSGNRPAKVLYETESTDMQFGVQALPFTFTVPNITSFIGTHMFSVFASYPDSSGQASTFYTVATVAPGNPTIKAVVAPKLFYPVRDGFQDVFAVSVVPDRAGTAGLDIFSGRKNVSHGTTKFTGAYAETVSAGSGLRAGTYTWSVTFTGLNGKTTTTKRKTLTADPRRATAHKVTTDGAPTKVPFHDYSGDCASVRKSGKFVILDSLDACSTARDNLAEAYFYPTLKAADGYSGITLQLATDGDAGEFDVLDGGTPAVAISGNTNPYGGTTTATTTLGSSVLAPNHQLQFEILTDGTLYVSSIALSYTYYTLN